MEWMDCVFFLAKRRVLNSERGACVLSRRKRPYVASLEPNPFPPVRKIASADLAMLATLVDIPWHISASSYSRSLERITLIPSPSFHKHPFFPSESSHTAFHTRNNHSPLLCTTNPQHVTRIEHQHRRWEISRVWKTRLHSSTTFVKAVILQKPICDVLWSPQFGLTDASGVWTILRLARCVILTHLGRRLEVGGWTCHE